MSEDYRDEFKRWLEPGGPFAFMKEDPKVYLSQPNYDCVHPDIPQPAFSWDKAQKMTVHEVRATYPRVNWTCEHCGGYGVSYASFEHYIAGDY